MQCPYFDQCLLTIDTVNKADNGCSENVSTLNYISYLQFSPNDLDKVSDGKQKIMFFFAFAFVFLF